MKQSTLFSRTIKEDPKDAKEVNHKLLVRGGYIEQLAAGIWSFLPLGQRVLQNVMRIVRQEINATGAQEVFLPTIQPKELWQETGRWETIDPPLFRVLDRHEKEYALGSTHEEVITDLARRFLFSHKQLPVAIYQLQTKFRNEVRATGGLLRTREFIMKDLYSFHANTDSLDEYYSRVREAYFRIFTRCGVPSLPVRASGGTIGGSETHEFIAEATSGEDTIVKCANCDFASNVEIAADLQACPECQGKTLERRSAIEIGQIFKLGTKYSAAMSAHFTDTDGTQKPIVMGCYGIGIGRLMATVVEINHDARGILWPKELAPFQAHLLNVSKSEEGKRRAEALYHALQKSGFEVLYDDRTDSPGTKFADADLLGMPVRLVVGERHPESIEWKERSQEEVTLVTEEEVLKNLHTFFA